MDTLQHYVYSWDSPVEDHIIPMRPNGPCDQDDTGPSVPLQLHTRALGTIGVAPYQAKASSVQATIT